MELSPLRGAPILSVSITLIIFRVNLLLLFIGVVSQGVLGTALLSDWREGTITAYTIGMSLSACSLAIFLIVPWFDKMRDDALECRFTRHQSPKCEHLAHAEDACLGLRPKVESTEPTKTEHGYLLVNGLV
jgi:hypothetical protein